MNKAQNEKAAQFKANIAGAEYGKASAQWVYRAMMAVYERQTETEKVARQTEEHNGVGFSGVDAEIMSSFAEQFKARKSLSAKQFALAQKKMQRYTRQLVEIAEQKEAEQIHAAAQAVKNNSSKFQPDLVAEYEGQTGQAYA